MSAMGYATEAAASLRPMREADLDAVMLVEERAYPYPWTRGIFRDCLRAGYPMWLLEQQGVIVGYGVKGRAAAHSLLDAGTARTEIVVVAPDRAAVDRLSGREEAATELVAAVARLDHPPVEPQHIGHRYEQQPRHHPFEQVHRESVIALPIIAHQGIESGDQRPGRPQRNCPW